MDITPGRYNIRKETGCTLDRVLTWTDDAGVPINLTGFSATMPIFITDDSSPSQTLTTGQGLTLGGAAGTIAIAIAAVSLPEKEYQYYILLTDATGAKGRLVYGQFGVEP